MDFDKNYKPSNDDTNMCPNQPTDDLCPLSFLNKVGTFFKTNESKQFLDDPNNLYYFDSKFIRLGFTSTKFLKISIYKIFFQMAILSLQSNFCKKLLN